MNDHAGSADLQGFARLIEALEPWLSQVVIIGGWAHRLFRCDSRAQSVGYQPIITLDTDVAVPTTLECNEKDVRSRLQDAGFREEFLGDHKPPATHYRLGSANGSLYAEFLTPLIGSEYDRRGNRRSTSQVAGITSQNLRYIDLLLKAPWVVKLSSANGYPLQDEKEVRIASPSNFIAQKLLIHTRRERRSRAKDLLYVHDTIEIFGASLDVLNREWNLEGRPSLSASAIEVIEQAADTLFATVTGDARAAAQSAIGRSLTGEAIRELCRAGLKFVFRKS